MGYVPLSQSARAFVMEAMRKMGKSARAHLDFTMRNTAQKAFWENMVNEADMTRQIMIGFDPEMWTDGQYRCAYCGRTVGPEDRSCDSCGGPT